MNQVDPVKNELILAMQAYKSGRLSDAIQIHQRLLETHPNHPEVLHHFGIVLYKQGEIDSAIGYMQQSLEISENQATVQLNLGRILFNQQKLKEAHPHLQRATQLEPEHPSSQIMLGRCLAALERFNEASEAFLKAFESTPEDMNLVNRLAEVIDKSGDTEGAVQWYQYILERDPNDATARKALGMAYRRTNRTADALRTFNEGVRLRPDDLEMLHNEAAQLEEMGQFADAAAAYRKVLTKNPKHAMSLGSLLKMPDAADVSAELDVATTLMSEDLEQFEQVFIAYALGKYHNRAGNYESAFHWFSEANTMQAASFPYDETRLDNYLDSVRQIFKPSMLMQREIKHKTGRQYLFIVGMPRSGTTLVEQILSSHGAVFGGGEIGCIVSYFGRGTDKWPALDSYGLPIDRWVKPRLIRARQRYIDIFDSFQVNEPVVTDKMPFNFLHLGAIRLMFPEAKIIYCCRNVMDNALSCFMENLTPEYNFATEFGRFAHYYSCHKQLMAFWQKLIGENMMTVRYESLIDDFEAHVHALLAFCGLPWDERCLHFYNTSRTVATPSNWQVRQPIYTSSKGRWQNYEPWLNGLKSALFERNIAAPFDS